MTQSPQQVAADLEFVKSAVERGDRETRAKLSPRWLGFMWGLIVLVGCVWNDVHPQTCWMYWAVVPMLGWVLSGTLVGKDAFMTGEFDLETGRRMGMHWSVCFLGAVPVVLMAFAGRIDGYTMGQMLILISGIVYYLAGVHFDRRWIWPGVAMIAGAAALCFVRHGGWSVVGAVTCLALVVGFWRTPRTTETAA